MFAAVVIVSLVLLIAGIVIIARGNLALGVIVIVVALIVFLLRGPINDGAEKDLDTAPIHYIV